jgi:hypothetical protein
LFQFQCHRPKSYDYSRDRCTSAQCAEAAGQRLSVRWVAGSRRDRLLHPLKIRYYRTAVPPHVKSRGFCRTVKHIYRHRCVPFVHWTRKFIRLAHQNSTVPVAHMLSPPTYFIVR